ncbi:MAG: hypothetical protein LAO51_19815 [Acidobacteriia bacterium]|nr:hypothetical protein [Terriglobia bacterium]
MSEEYDEFEKDAVEMLKAFGITGPVRPDQEDFKAVENAYPQSVPDTVQDTADTAERYRLAQANKLIRLVARWRASGKFSN